MKLKVLLLFLLTLCAISWAQETPLQFAQPKNTPYLESQLINADTSEYNTVLLKIKAEQNGMAQLFWATSYDPQFNQYKTVAFPLEQGIHKYTINVPSQNPNWIGWVRKIILLPNAPIELRSATIIKGNLFTNIASGWQEFWGPRGRVETGSTINLIPSSTIFGRSVNIYIYWIIVTAFFAFLIIYFIKQSNISKAYQTAIRSTIILMIGFWILLTLNADYNYCNLFKNNFSKYFGKSIEEKRAVAYGKEYYDFLVFAKEKLPEEPINYRLISAKYTADLQARIFLTPHIQADRNKEKVLYLLVYQPDIKQLAAIKGYYLFKKQKDNAYIMKRIDQ